MVDLTTAKAEQTRTQVEATRARRRNNPALMKVLRERLILRTVREVNRSHAYIERGNDVMIVTAARDYKGRLDLKFRSKTAVAELYDFRQLKLPKISDRSVSWEWANPIRIWSRHPQRRNLRGMVNAPGVFLGPEWLNAWEGWGTKPKATADGSPDFSGAACPLILNHLRDIWCGGSEPVFRWVLAWFADMLQNPTRKPDTAIMTYSGQGTGKSIIVETVIARILGTGYGYEDDGAFMSARFNKRVAGKLLIYADEAVFAGDRQAADRLKAFVSKKQIEIEEKGKDSFALDHHARLFSATNRDHALLMESDDRRWLVLEVSERRKGDHAYFDALGAEMDGGGVEAFHAYLLNPALLDGVNLRKTPDTPASVSQKVQSLQSVQAYVYECLHQRTVQLGFTDAVREEWDERGVRVGKADLYRGYLDWTKALNNRYPERDTAFHSTVQKLLPSAAVGRNGNEPRHYKLPALAVARGEFEEWIGCPEDPASLARLWSDGEAGSRPDPWSGERDATPVTINTLSARADVECPF